MGFIQKMKSLLFFCLLTISANSQNLKQTSLTMTDKKKGIVSKYEYNATDSYSEIRLIFLKNANFEYTLRTFNQDVFSTGKWARKGNTLTLRSHLSTNNLPVKLVYKTDTSDLINGFKIGVVRNLNGKLMTDGLVNINNDSIQCVPLMSLCYPQLTTIDSIRIVFENGMSSKWIKIEKQDYLQVVPIVQTNFLISSYIVFDNRKYQILKSSLKPIE